MASFYTVVQYVPDPVADERVNIGVIAFNDGAVVSRFLRNWSRVRQFGEHDMAFLQSFAANISRAGTPSLPIPGLPGTPLTPESVRKLSGEWIHSVQLTEPRASILDPKDLLDDMATRLLRDPPRHPHAFRDKRSIIRKAKVGLEAAVGDESSIKIRVNNVSVRGGLADHRFDLGVANSKLLLVAKGLSFEGPASRELEREVDATAWALSDIREAQDDKPNLAVVALPPKSRSRQHYELAKGIFGELGADVVEESQVTEWSANVVRRAQKD